METILIVGQDGNPVMINLSDYDASVHVLCEGQAAPVAVVEPVAAPVAVVEPVAAPVAVVEPVAAPVAPTLLVRPNGKTGKAQRFTIVDESGNVIQDDFETETAAWDAIIKR